MSKYYIVVNGRIPGIYTSWQEAKAQVISFPKAIYKSFNTALEAETYYKDSTRMSKQEINTDCDLVLYTDGSCTEGRYGGCGVLYIINDVVISKEKYMVPEYPTTNNRAELYAIYCGLLTTSKYIQKTYGLSGIVYLFTDSLTSIQSLISYAGFKKSEECTCKLANIDILEKIYPLLDKVILRHVDAHKDNKFNEEVDILAREGVVLSKVYFNSLSTYGTYDT